MKKCWYAFVIVAYFWVCVSAFVFAAETSPALISAVVPDKPVKENSIYPVDSSNLPAGMLDLMKDARSIYLEGSSLIRSGDSDKAREAFDKAVDLLLNSNWDLTSTPALNAFFLDLIQRIEKDESRYLAVQNDDSDEQIEKAVLDDLDSLDLTSLVADPSLRETLIADLGKTQYDIPITINESVVKSLDFWLNRGRQYFIDGLQRSGQYRQMIEQVFREESIPLDLMYLAQVESLFKPYALSKAQAKGIWQFGKGTAIRYGLKVTRDVDERSDPEKSTRAAAHYLNDLFAMFKDWNLALAAYNWGEGNVQRLIDKTGLNDFWQLIDLKRKLPEETKNHVPLIQASVILARNPEKYGLPAKLDPPLKYAEVSVSKPIDLRAAARVLSTSIDELKKLNPSLKGLTTPANYPDFQLKVPLDCDPETHDQLATLPQAKVILPPEYSKRHKVRSGETIGRIAARYNISIAALEKANNISSKKKLIVGTWLQIPSKTNRASKVSTVKASSAGKTSAVKTSNAGKKSSATKTSNTASSAKPVVRKSGTGKTVSNTQTSSAKTVTSKNRADKKISAKQVASK
jgi:membrane-bound lytic murein transglycosylase D